MGKNNKRKVNYYNTNKFNDRDNDDHSRCNNECNVVREAVSENNFNNVGLENNFNNVGRCGCGNPGCFGGCGFNNCGFNNFGNGFRNFEVNVRINGTFDFSSCFNNCGFGNNGFGNCGFGNCGFGNNGFGNNGFGNCGFGNNEFYEY